MITNLLFARDNQGYNAEAPQFSTNTYSATLATGTASSFTVPSSTSTWYMVIKVEPAGWCWVSRTGTAEVPAGDTIAANTSEIATGTWEFRRTVYAGDVISLATPNTTCDIGVSLYAVSYP
jgi:hypothetical protein